MSSSPVAEELRARLRQVPLLASLGDAQLDALAGRVRVRTYPPGARLTLEGTYGDTLFIVHEGEVEVFLRRRGERVVLARRGAGSFFGDMALIEGGLRTATVETVTRCTVVEIPKPAFDILLAENAAIATFFVRELSQRLRHTDSRMVDDLLAINADLLAAQRRIEESYDTTLAALSSALDLRDTETEGHSQRVCDYAAALGKRVGLDEGQLKALQRGALLHDLGKIGIADAILRKPSHLDAQEREQMRKHSGWGAEILRGIPFLRDAVPVVRSHHEWWNGSGYPDGLRGEAIPLFARIFAVADTFDALTTARPYRSAHAPRDALEIMRQEAGTHLDPHLFALFERMFPSTIEPMWRDFQQRQRRSRF